MEIRIYVEGGGDQGDGKRRIQHGFGRFFEELRAIARHKRIQWAVIACGGRNSTFDAYQTALRTHSGAFNVILVDSEGPVDGLGRWQYLRSRDGWIKPEQSEDSHCHMMVETMEAWLIADRKALRDFYGNSFHEPSLPNNQNVEEIPRQSLDASLKNATRHTQKGRYHKTKHAPLILQRLRLSEVCTHAPHCKRLVSVLTAQIEASC